jgi:CheY-like chemotaxis protein
VSDAPACPTSALVIDDQADVREYLKAVLETANIPTVVTASGMREALAAVTEPGARFDLILCDLQMPEAGGVETLRALAAMGQQAWVIVLSVEPVRIIETVGMLTEAQGLHILGAVQKPLTVEGLEDLLAHAPVAPVAPTTEHVQMPEGDIANALLGGELRLVYQPKVRMRTRAFVAVEALVR